LQRLIHSTAHQLNTKNNMKFTELLENWMDARQIYNEAKNKFQYDYPYLDEQHSIMIKYQHQINDVIERLETFCDENY